MSEKKRCIRCDRPIDAYARICPFCNWDQSDFAVARVEQNAELAYVPPREHSLRRYVLIALAGVVLLIASFALGSRLQRRKPVKGLNDQPEKTSKAPVRPAQHAAVTLVPDTDIAAIEQPITSAPAANPAEGVPTEYQRSDATAVSSAEYAQLAARALAEKKKAAALIDPRSLKGAASEQSAPPQQQSQISSSSAEAPPATSTPAATESRSETAAAPAAQHEPSRAAARTRPVPEYQPVPDIQVKESTTARLQLTVGADGRVQEVNVLQGVPGQTAKIISTVQTWRFKPATENGNPVPAPFSVDLSFRGNE